jgi:hypothetical protein
LSEFFYEADLQVLSRYQGVGATQIEPAQPYFFLVPTIDRWNLYRLGGLVFRFGFYQ